MRARKDGETCDSKKNTMLKSAANRRTQYLPKSMHLWLPKRSSGSHAQPTRASNKLCKTVEQDAASFRKLLFFSRKLARRTGAFV